MCDWLEEIYNVTDIQPYIYEDELIESVYNGEINPFELPVSVYEYNFEVLIFAVALHYGLPIDFKKGSKAYKLAVTAKNNIAVFSGAKTFQQVLDLSNNVFGPTGNIKPFSEFKKIAKKINKEYNVNYLRVEQQAAIRQSESIKYWQQIQEEKDTLPYLEYITVGDSRVRPDHRDKDGIIKRIDDPFWNTWYPPNDWFCRCRVVQREKAVVNTKKYAENDNPVFASNVGKTGVIFSDKHPYFDIPKEFKESNSKNFGFKTPSDKNIKQNGNN